jgi:hypothetical protein
MNFKPTLLKTIVSLIGGIFLGLFIFTLWVIFTSDSAGFQDPYTLLDRLIEFGAIVGSIILIYIVYSFIQNKN